MIRDIFDFIRFGISLSLAFLSISGYLLFNPAGVNIFLVVLGSFFLSCSTYGYNVITDKEEDSVNRHVNPLALSKAGWMIVIFCLFLGLIFSSLFSTTSALVSFTIIVTGITYSRFRVKKYLLVKNLYTAFFVSLFFIMGAVRLSFDLLEYYLAIYLFFFIGSVISDLRDYEGDKKAGVRTIPVCFGFGNTKKVVYLLLAFIFILLFRIGALKLLPLLVSVPVCYLLVSMDKPRLAHIYGGVSVFFLTLWLVLWL